MDVVKFVRFENKGDLTYLYFKLCDSLADFVRKKYMLWGAFAVHVSG